MFIVKVALLLPAGTITLEGTLAAPLLLESVTCAPPAGAGPLSVTVPVEDCSPPMTLVGFKVSEETVGRGGGVTVSEADTLVLESVACAPPAGAGPLSVTVPVDDCVPPVALIGLNVSEETVGGVTVSEADMLTPP